MIAPAIAGDRRSSCTGRPETPSTRRSRRSPARTTTSRTRVALASGRDVLVTDTGNFQSVLFSFDRDEPSYFPGLALAVDGDLVVTAQNVGTNATVNAFDHTGEQSSPRRRRRCGPG